MNIEHELIKKSTELFKSDDDWNAFIELSNLKDRIVKEWYSILEDEIDKSVKLQNGWKFRRHSDFSFQWYLDDATDGMSLWLEGADFSLWANGLLYNIENIREALLRPEFNNIRNGISTPDVKFDNNYFFREIGRFRFDNIAISKFDRYQISWFAGNKSEEFAQQLAQKLAPFMDKDATMNILKLNSIKR